VEIVVQMPPTCHLAWQDGRLRARIPHHQNHPSRPRHPTTSTCLHHNVGWRSIELRSPPWKSWFSCPHLPR